MRFYLHLALWCALFAVFLFFSIPVVGPALLENKIGPIDPNHSTDSYLSGLTRVRNGTELFARVVETLPRDKSITVFVDAGSSSSEFLGMLVAYLSWPRDVQIIRVNPSTYSRELSAINASSVSDVIFCNLKPPVWIKNKTNFGSSITVVSAESLTPNQ